MWSEKEWTELEGKERNGMGAKKKGMGKGGKGRWKDEPPHGETLLYTCAPGGFWGCSPREFRAFFRAELEYFRQLYRILFLLILQICTKTNWIILLHMIMACEDE